jgi:hypothetical protein
VVLGRLLDGGQFPPDAGAGDARTEQHLREDIGIEHALHGNAFGGGLDSEHAANGVHQRLAMVRAGAPHQGAIDIEQNQSRMWDRQATIM